GHYRLSHMKLEAILRNGDVQVVTEVPHFTWTWQITYPYKYQPAYPKGTVLHSIAWHDNTAANKENPDPTAFVGGGARTVDEMNIGWLHFYYISDEEYTQASKAQQEREKAEAAATGNHERGSIRERHGGLTLQTRLCQAPLCLRWETRHMKRTAVATLALLGALALHGDAQPMAPIYVQLDGFVRNKDAHTITYS